MDKTRVAVLRGGPSEEYEVSLNTGRSVLASLDRNKFDPLDVVITKNGEWLVDGCERFPEKLLSIVDVAFLALHGAYGEDGTVQKILDRHGVRYTGSKAYPSSIAMNKAITKKMLRGDRVKMSPHMTISRDSVSDLYSVSKSISEMFGPEYVIKPVASGSSKGTRMVENSLMLAQALEDVLTDYSDIIVEQRIIGREGTCGVIENFRGEAVYALPVIEIVPPTKAGFFNSDAKYNGETDEICPGRFSEKIKDEMESIAKYAHETLGLRGYSRSDFMIDGEDVYFLEVNTLPGLTEQSLFPKAVEAVGGNYRDFLTHLLTEALEYK